MAHKISEKDGKDVFASDNGLVKGVDVNQRTVILVASDETKDRDGDIISVKDWQLDNYIKNPVFLWAHDYKSVPIGKCIKI